MPLFPTHQNIDNEKRVSSSSFVFFLLANFSFFNLDSSVLKLYADQLIYFLLMAFSFWWACLSLYYNIKYRKSEKIIIERFETNGKFWDVFNISKHVVSNFLQKKQIQFCLLFVVRTQVPYGLEFRITQKHTKNLS